MDTAPLSFDPNDVDFSAGGLIPVVAQDAYTLEVRMLAWANREALEATLQTGEAHYFSRSRNELWRKGATSGNVQRVRAVRLDCDRDALLYMIEVDGPACHTGRRSCFHHETVRVEPAAPGEAMALLARVVEDRWTAAPEGSYVASLRQRGLGYVSQKVVEEAGETVVAALMGDEDVAAEAADLIFHLSVLLRARGVAWHEVEKVLWDRHRTKSKAPAGI